MARTRSYKYNGVLLVFSVVFIAALIIVLLQWVQSQKEKFAFYEEFGIEIPVAYSMHGIDVSRHQKKIAWNWVKNMKVKEMQLNFAFIKATEGARLVDIQFQYNWKESKKNEMTRGAYHFFTPNDDPVKQARFFISKVKLEPGDLPPVLDAEIAGTAPVKTYRDKLKIWLDIIERHYNEKPIIYTSADFYNKYMGTAFDQHPLWVAHYYERKSPRVDRPWFFWQHNDRGNVNGIDAKVDFNVFNGDITAFQQLLLK